MQQSPTSHQSEIIQRFLKRCCLPAVIISWTILSFYAYFSSIPENMKVGLSDGLGHPFGQCFVNFWAGAKLAAAGKTADIYNWELFHAFQQSTVNADLIYYHYSYPPVLPLLTFPLALFSYVPAFVFWIVATWALFYIALRAAHPPVSALLLSLVPPAFLLNVAAGQNGMLTAALLGGGLVLLPKRPVVAGILFGLLCFKPQLAFLLPVALIAGRYWRTLFAAAATSVLLVVISFILYGPQIWMDYSHTAEHLRHYVLEDNTAQSWQQFVSIFVMARQLGASIAASYALQGLFALGAALAIIKLWGGRASHDIRCAALVLGSFAATPYAMDYDLVIMAFVCVWLNRSYRRPHFAIASLLVMSLIAAVADKIYGIGIGPLMLVPGCLLILSSCGLPGLREQLVVPQDQKSY
jgi:Glycosyltransferase family 87